MATTKAAASAPTPKVTEPRLERHFNVRRAAIELGLIADPDDPADTAGERWLRDGFNRPADGSKGRKFPGVRMGRQLMFSESDLVAITQIAREETEARQTAKDTPSVSTGRPRRARRTAKTPALASA